MLRVKATHCWSFFPLRSFFLSLLVYAVWSLLTLMCGFFFFYKFDKRDTNMGRTRWFYFWSVVDDLICKYDCLRGLLYWETEQPHEFKLKGVWSVWSQQDASYVFFIWNTRRDRLWGKFSSVKSTLFIRASSPMGYFVTCPLSLWFFWGPDMTSGVWTVVNRIQKKHQKSLIFFAVF